VAYAAPVELYHAKEYPYVAFLGRNYCLCVKKKQEGERGGRGETGMVVGGKVPESVGVCVHVYANCESIERTEEPFSGEEGKNNIDNKQEKVH